jgi:hypothetical protein
MITSWWARELEADQLPRDSRRMDSQVRLIASDYDI